MRIMKFNQEKYALAEIELASKAVVRSSENVQQKNRLAYWLAFMGATKTAQKYASPEMSEIIKKFNKIEDFVITSREKITQK